jgi:hypothetical protein
VGINNSGAILSYYYDNIYKDTYHLRFIPEGVAKISDDSSETPTIYQSNLGMRNTKDMTVCKPIVV